MSLHNKFLLDLDYSLFTEVCLNLDIEAKYRDLVAAADKTRFRLEVTDVEEFARALYTLNGSPSVRLLQRWGNSMRVSELVGLLDHLRLERCQLPIRLHEPLHIVTQPVERIHLKERDTLHLNCEAVGFPYPIYDWFQVQKQLSSSSSGKLEITNVSSQNAGQYECRIYHVNHVTKQPEVLFSKKCVVVIETCSYHPNHDQRDLNPTKNQRNEALTIVCHPVSQVIRQSNQLNLRCEAAGTGLLQYHWVRNMELISPGQQYNVSTASTADSGEYFCIVRNGFEEVHSVIATIKVIADGIPVPDKPEILQQPVDISSETGGKALFSVKAQYCMDLSYQWYHLTENGHSDTIEDGDSAELRVEVQGKYNAGTYQCRIYAPDGKEVMSRTAKLTVTGERKTYKAADKLALIIGVSTYRSHGGSLAAVEHDVQATVAVFEKMKFKVVSLLDLTLSEMTDAINMFCDLLSQDVYAVFYCAGHGFVGNDGRHYLIPWDAFHATRPSESLCIETVEELMQQKKPKLLMFFLDICRRRNNNLTDPPRVIQTSKAVPNKIIVYAASEGQEAYEESRKVRSVPRGLFNKCLLEVIDKPLGAIDLYKALMDKFRTLPYDCNKYPQSPEISTNNVDYERTLLDPVDMELSRTNINVIRSTNLWCISHVLPSSAAYRVLNIGIMNVTFKRITSNVMDMYVIPELSDGWRLSVTLLEDNIPACVKPVTPFSKNEPPGTVCFRFPNLQRLQTDLVVSFKVLLIEDIPGQTIRIHPIVNMVQLNLRRPLAAVPFIKTGQQQRSPSLNTVSLPQTDDSSVSSDTADTAAGFSDNNETC